MPEARKPITEFRTFIDGLNDARCDEYLGQPHSAIADEEAFSQVQAYLRDYYSGVESVHSFLDANGSVFDCIPIEQQYALRRRSGSLPQPPELPVGLARPSDDVSKRVIQLHENFVDRLGNRMFCPDGSIPVQRLTLPWLARFANLTAFLGKYYDRRHRSLPPVAVQYAPLLNDIHQWAVGEQSVENHGGGAVLNVWDPVPAYPPQLMSLSQVWFASADRQQTVEAGWQVNPYRYPHTKPVLFCYWTSYSAGHCYNLLCPGFVQTDNTWMLGGALPSWSSPGGAQIELAVAYRLEVDKWWLIVDGTCVGYYPTSLFQTGTLGTKADLMLCGGEVATSSGTSWPPMGSGEFAAEHYGRVAYSKQIQSITLGGATKDASLQVRNNGHAECYTAIAANYRVSKDPHTLAPWNETLWFGGTPPASCQCA